MTSIFTSSSIGMMAIIMLTGIVIALLAMRAQGSKNRADDRRLEESARPVTAATADPADAVPSAATTAAMADDISTVPNAHPTATVPAASDITQLKGLGPKLAATLASLGYTRLEQIASLSPDQAAALDAELGSFQGRMARDRWIEQAKLLVAGDRAGYEAAFGKLG